MSCRDWFDDEEFEDESLGAAAEREEVTIPSVGTELSLDASHADPIVVESIRSSLDDLRYVDLREVLKSRRLRSVGSKSELQHRLLHSLLDDEGLVP
jgi:hypothetical protein